MESHQSRVDDKLATFEKRQVATEYKVSDIVKMLALVESFTTTYDSEAIQTRAEIHTLTQSLSETRVLSNCLEQKLHYIERELNWVTSAVPRRPKVNSGTITEKSSEYATVSSQPSI
jgi:hypothetical protein